MSDIDISKAQVFSKTKFSMDIDKVKEVMLANPQRNSVVLFGVESTPRGEQQLLAIMYAWPRGGLEEVVHVSWHPSSNSGTFYDFECNYSRHPWDHEKCQGVLPIVYLGPATVSSIISYYFRVSTLRELTVCVFLYKYRIL